MLLLTTAFLAGISLLQFCATLPPAWAYAAVPVALFVLRWRLARWPAVLILGFFWSALLAEAALDPVLDPAVEGRTILIEGQVLDRPEQRSGRRQRFLFQVERLDAGQGWSAFNGRVRLSLYGAGIEPATAERWQLAVRLKRPHGFANPGGFDYEQWLFQQGIRATGYVRQSDSRNRRLAIGDVSYIDQFRSRLMTAYDAMQPGSPSLAIIRALTIGDRSQLDTGQWNVLRATGTSHLMAISGLHISLVAGLVFWLMKFVWVRTGWLVERCPASKVAAVAAVLAALAYALLAGFTLPTRRAVIMVAVFMFSIVADQKASFSRAIALAVLVTLLLDPLAVLAPGWWLSFWAVTVIAYCAAGRHGVQGLARKWLYMHFVLAVTMVPLLLVFFQQASLIAPLANSLAVPYVGMVVVPVALAGTVLFRFSEGVGEWVLNAAAWLMDLVWPWLEGLAGLRHALWHQQPVSWTLLPALAGLILLFMPRGIPGRWLAILLFLPLLVVVPPRPAPGEARVSLLDVGQGLAVVVQTHNHALVYDTGPRFSDSFDTGRAVVVPFLRHAGIRSLDKLIISHGDNDHIGGAASVLAEYPAHEVLSSVPGRLAGAGAVVPCRRGRQWVWEGVHFTLLHPAHDGVLQGNDASCVLRIESAGGQRVLLTGDIEAPAEQALLRLPGQPLTAQVLVVPHHGSATSSTTAFIEAVSPATVLFPSGYRNRWGFPKPEVVARYAGLDAQMYETGLSGAITVTLSSGNEQSEVRRYRQQRRRYWQAAAIP